MSAPTIPLAWHHLVLQVPAAWEVIGYKKNPDDGKLVVADRHGETLHAYWRRMTSPPSVERALIGLVAAQPDIDLSEGAIRKAIFEVAGWSVFLTKKEGTPSFATRHHAPEECLLNLTFPPHPDTAEPKVIRRILESWDPNDGEERRWAAFGIECTLPKEYELDEVSPLPAAQVMTFATRKDEIITVHRYGMMPAVLGKDDPATFFARIKGRKAVLRREGEFQQGGRYSGVRLAYATRGKGGFDALLARTWQGRVWVWRCDDIKRLYAVDQHARQRRLIDNLAQRVVSR